ncbi:ECF transporter S component [Ligilactobacillus sp. WILCCON 0076]|uniref:ECF transporter S component n=1 Tax=Ligilactobacillus ubinensis TaxID=2876789 RepID=A0A9X2FKQ2_9LACO|nr:ECF transporter S component [Ligilactobacillus ubinensis]MCP0887327.1 ECF transporter S component [Ligilactobacillus ubinensis]
MNELKLNTKQISILAMLTAANVVIARFLIIPIPMTHGYINLCDAGIILAAFLFGANKGGVVGALSGFLLDLISGYPQYMFFSLIVHGIEGYIIGRLSTKNSQVLGKVFAIITGIIIMVIGYLATDSILYSVQTGLIGIVPNIIQGLVGGLVGGILYIRLRHLI